jgi:hypothetical protein
MLATVRLAVALLAAGVTLIGAIPRILLAAGALPDPLRPFVWSDVLFVYLRGLSGHRIPYLDAPFEYPPLVALASGVFSRASDSAVVFVVLWAVAQAILAGAAGWMLAGAAGARTAARRFALAPQLLLLGAANFDLLAVAFFVAAVRAARARREIRAAAFLALGTLGKLFPLAAAPVLVVRAARPVRVALVGAGILIAGYAAPAILDRSSAGGGLYYLVGIDANFDSPWGLLSRVLTVAGVQGSHELIVAISLIGLAATYVLGVLPRARAADPAVPFGLAVVATLLWSRLYSPQYSLWVLPLFVLLPLSGRLFAVLAAGDLIVFFTVYPLTLVRWSPNDGAAAALLGALAAGVVLRLAALVGIWRSIRRETDDKMTAH